MDNKEDKEADLLYENKREHEFCRFLTNEILILQTLYKPLKTIASLSPITHFSTHFFPQLFNNLDTSGDGCLQSDELEAAFTSLSDEVTP